MEGPDPTVKERSLMEKDKASPSCEQVLLLATNKRHESTNRALIGKRTPRLAVGAELMVIFPRLGP